MVDGGVVVVWCDGGVVATDEILWGLGVEEKNFVAGASEE